MTHGNSRNNLTKLTGAAASEGDGDDLQAKIGTGEG